MIIYLNILSSLILLSTILLVSCKRITSYIKSFQLQSLLIAIGAGIMGVDSFINSGQIDIIVVCLLIIVLKVIYIPIFLHKVNGKIEKTVEKDFFLNIPLLITFCGIIILFVFFSVSSIDGLNSGSLNMRIVDLISVVLIGLLFMMTRKKAIGQIIGFLVIENGLFITAMFATNGMPFIVDLGIFIDLLTGVLIMGLMVYKIDELFESININELKNLRG